MHFPQTAELLAVATTLTSVRFSSWDLIYKCNGPLVIRTCCGLVPAESTTKGEFFTRGKGDTLEMEGATIKLQVVPGQKQLSASGLAVDG